MKQIGVIGSGAMGSGIAQVAASSGHQVFVYDNNQAALDKAKSNLETTLKKLVEKQKYSDETASGIFQRTHFINDIKEFKNCELVIEAIVENLEIKQKLFIELESIVSSECMLASNT